LTAAQAALLPTQPISTQINLGLLLWLDEKRGARHSLNVRNQMALEDGAKLWLRHVLEAELSSRSCQRQFMMWPSFLQDWRSQFKLMAVRLGVEMHAGSERGVDGFLSSELRR